MPAPTPDASLPAAVPLLATLGLAILMLCTVPAVRSQQRLEREHARLRQETLEAERDVERLRKSLRDSAPQRYLRIRATRDLLLGGAGYIESRDRKLGRGR